MAQASPRVIDGTDYRVGAVRVSIDNTHARKRGNEKRTKGKGGPLDTLIYNVGSQAT
jgi:hypothetical protein